VKRLSEKLSSLNMTVVVLILLMIWLTWGILMVGSVAYKEGFSQMNSRVLRDWLMESGGDYPLHTIWFSSLCVVMGFLGLNLIFCSWHKMLRAVRVKFNGPKCLMLMVHAVFGLVALGHFGGFMLGYRFENVRLQVGGAFVAPQGLEVFLEEVHFVDDPRTLRKSNWDLTRGEFNRRSNFAEVSLYERGREIRRERIFHLKPMRHKDFQVTLKRFTSSEEMGRGSGGQPGVLLVVTRNPILKFFLASYAAMILGIGIYLAITWRRS
jgi:hypothetical protein